ECSQEIAVDDLNRPAEEGTRIFTRFIGVNYIGHRPHLRRHGHYAVWIRRNGVSGWRAAIKIAGGSQTVHAVLSGAQGSCVRYACRHDVRGILPIGVEPCGAEAVEILANILRVVRAASSTRRVYEVIRPIFAGLVKAG